jgi:hypothetical protein
MKRGKRALQILAACGLIGLLAVALWPGKKEPEYKGKKLSEWAEIYEDSFRPMDADGDPPAVSKARTEAIEAAHCMRDQILPRALRMIVLQKPAWKDRVENFMEMKLNVRTWCPLWVWRPFYGDRSEDNQVYFMMLGSDASPAVPELTRIMKHAEAGRIRERAMFALACIGKEGLGPLLEVVADPKNPDRRRAAYAILDMKRWGTEPSEAVPVLVKSLDDPDVDVSGTGAMILGKLALNAEMVVPALARSLRHNNWYVREQAAEALGKFGAKARPAAAALFRAMADQEDSVCRPSAEALVEIWLDRPLE